MKNYNLIIN